MSVPPWLLFALLTILFWGSWSFQSKVISGADALGVPAAMNHVLGTIGGFLVLPLLALRRRSAPPPRRSVRGSACAFLSGVAGSSGNILFYLALARPDAMGAVVTPLVALYPLVTVLLAIGLLKERLGKAQAAGVALSLAAVVLLSMEESPGGAGLSPTAVLSRGWFWLSLACIPVYGLAGLLQKLATNSISSVRTYVYFSFGYLATALAVLATTDLAWGDLRAGAALFGLLGGVLNGLGALALFASLGLGGKASVIFPLTGCYPLVTVALAMGFLGERLRWYQAAGAIVAVAAGVLFGVERRTDGNRRGRRG